MAIFQLRYYPHYPSSPSLPNQWLDWRYLPRSMHYCKYNLSQVESTFSIFAIYQPVGSWLLLTSQLPYSDTVLPKTGLEKRGSRESLWNNNRNLSLYRVAFAEASPWIGYFPTCLQTPKNASANNYNNRGSRLTQESFSLEFIEKKERNENQELTENENIKIWNTWHWKPKVDH